MRCRAPHVLQGPHQLLLAARRRRHDRAGRRARRRRGVPTRVRAGEQAHLAARRVRRANHFVEFLVRQEKHPGALGDAMDGDVQAPRLLEHRLQAAWAFGARDLDPVLRAVGKALRGRRELVQVPPGRPIDSRNARVGSTSRSLRRHRPELRGVRPSSSYVIEVKVGGARTPRAAPGSAPTFRSQLSGR